MTAVVLCLLAHQPYRLRREPGGARDPLAALFDDELNATILRRVAERCYRPVSALLHRLVQRHEGRFRFALSVSGTALAQLAATLPDVVRGFAALARSSAVEILGETSHHSLAAVAAPAEFEEQVRAHRGMVRSHLGAAPVTFCNTELVVDERIAAHVERLGHRVALGEGADPLLLGRSPHARFRPHGCQRLALLLRDYAHSDDLGFRFGDPAWTHHPLRPATYAAWLHRVPRERPVIGLFLDLETFGEHKPAASGILAFLEELPAAVLADPRFAFATPTEAAAGPAEPLAIPTAVSWADRERDLSAWLGNPMQRAAHEALYGMLPAVRRAARARPELLETWRRLSTSDHFYYMATKTWTDGYVHQAFSPHAAPLDAFAAHMRAQERLAQALG